MCVFSMDVANIMCVGGMAVSRNSPAIRCRNSGAGNGSVGAAEEALVRRGEGGRQKVLDAVVVKHAGTEAPQSVIMVCGFQFQHLVDLNCDGGRQLVLNIVHQARPVLFSIQNFRSFTH